MATKTSINEQPLSKGATKPFCLASSGASAIQLPESDAELLRLGAKWLEMRAALAAADREHDASDETRVNNRNPAIQDALNMAAKEAEARGSALFASCREFRDDLLKLPVTSMAGLLLKAEFAAFDGPATVDELLWH